MFLILGIKKPNLLGEGEVHSDASLRETDRLLRPSSDLFRLSPEFRPGTSDEGKQAHQNTDDDRGTYHDPCYVVHVMVCVAPSVLVGLKAAENQEHNAVEN